MRSIGLFSTAEKWLPQVSSSTRKMLRRSRFTRSMDFLNSPESSDGSSCRWVQWRSCFDKPSALRMGCATVYRSSYPHQHKLSPLSSEKVYLSRLRTAPTGG